MGDSLRLNNLVGAAIGFVVGSVASGFLYGILPTDITTHITEENFKVLSEVLFAYLGYKEF